MAQHPRGKRKIAAEQLLSGASATDAAASAGISRVTLWSWSKDDPVFLEYMRTGTDAALATAARRLKASADEAVTTMIGVMRDGGGHGAMARLRAADMVLQHGARLAELVDIMARLDTLEARQQ